MNIVDKINFILNNFDEVNEGKGDGEQYERFFRKMLKKYGVKEPDELSRKQKKKFFKEVEDTWNKENPKNNDNDR